VLFLQVQSSLKFELHVSKKLSVSLEEKWKVVLLNCARRFALFFHFFVCLLIIKFFR